MHGRTRLALHGLCHERRVHVVSLCGLANRALEDKDLVCHRQRAAVIEVDLQLGGAVLMNQRIDIQLLLVCKVVHVLHEILKLCNSIDAVGETCDLAATRTALGRHQLIVGVGVFVDQIELHLGRHHRFETGLFIEPQHITQHVASRQRMRLAIGLVAIGNNLPGGLTAPGHQSQGRGIGSEQHVSIGWLNEIPVVVGVLTGHRLHHDGFG